MAKEKSKPETVLVNVPIKDVHSNPFRPKDLPYDQARINALVEDMTANGVWPNIVARERLPKGAYPTEYELAYGHHRLAAIKALGQKTVNLLVSDIPDEGMMKAWIAENSHEYKKIDTAQDVEQIKAAIQFLIKHPDYVHATLLKPHIKQDSALKKAMSAFKSRGPGGLLLSRFLGINRTRVEYYLAYLKMGKKDLKRNPGYMQVITEVKAAREKAQEARQAAGKPKRGRKPKKEVEPTISNWEIACDAVMSLRDVLPVIKKKPQLKQIELSLLAMLEYIRAKHGQLTSKTERSENANKAKEWAKKK